MPWNVITLGASRPLPRGSSDKIALLHQLKLCGFPIPHGATVIIQGDTCPFESLEATFSLQEKLQVLGLAAKVAVRPSSVNTSSQTTLNVELGDTPSLQNALLKAWRQPVEGNDRFPILIQDMTAGRLYGVVQSEEGYQEDLLRFSIAGGPPNILTIPKIYPQEARKLPDFRARVQWLLRDLRRALGSEGWEVHFLDNGAELQLLEVRALSPTLRNDLFTEIYFSNLIPKGPAPFLASFLELSSRRFLAYFHHLDPDIPRNRPLIEPILGRPLLNVSLLFDMARYLGLPSRLVTHSIRGDARVVFLSRFSRLWRNAPLLARLVASTLTSLRSARQQVAELKAWQFHPDTALPKLLKDTEVVAGQFVQTHFTLKIAENIATEVLRRLKGAPGTVPPFWNLWGQLRHRVDRYRNFFLKNRTELDETAARVFADLRHVFEQKALAWYAEEKLPSPDSFWSLTVDEVKVILEEGPRPAEFWEKKAKEMESWRVASFSGLCHRYSQSPTSQS